ncbi:tRNA-uridine aminocarboxypropyltransferase [Oceanispirochaeta crateris]|uniref:tRNA-uridine aminocarboxypropyltransferase n=1 Tax=Oceanispirochaeta crateris TaxID=2518645 RepID=UPI001AEF480E|nr:tRNA-uridine aminocarboxypropyltransferase [Oceanispirochaeta crateris]
MKFHLLTHKKEFKRPSNTGAVVVQALGSADARQVLWERVSPDQELLSHIASGKALLVYPEFLVSEERICHNFKGIEHMILLDGTWQEARKMYNRSPYLKNMKIFSIRSDKKSEYNIRRNQKDGGFCTAECVIEVLKIQGEVVKAASVTSAFKDLMNRMVSRVIP